MKPRAVIFLRDPPTEAIPDRFYSQSLYWDCQRVTFKKLAKGIHSLMPYKNGSQWNPFSSAAFNNRNFFFAEAVEVVDEAVDLLIRGRNLALEEGLVVVRIRYLEQLVQ